MQHSEDRAIGLEIIDAKKSFGSFHALDSVSLKVSPGTIHALLGENGAGKSTLVKGIVGYAPFDEGSILLKNHKGVREVTIDSPRDAFALGIGMVYQHFTLAEGLNVAENLLLTQGRLPWRIRWHEERLALQKFMNAMPFSLGLDRVVGTLAAGEKQKLEILKQLYLRQRLIILDEPTSVLTPQEAEEVLGLMRDLTRRGQLSVLMITHKFAEVTRFADDVTVLRKGCLAGSKSVSKSSTGELATWMMGSEPVRRLNVARPPVSNDATDGISITGLRVDSDNGTPAVIDLTLSVRRGEILGLAGISGNGQKELVETLTGQRRHTAGEVHVNGKIYHATRVQMREQQVYALPEEPLRNACVASMSVEDNLALRNFELAPVRRGGWLVDRRAVRHQANAQISAFNVQPPDPQLLIGTLSGGNVQRAVLAREFNGLQDKAISVLIAANPVFGLDFTATADIHDRLLYARERGVAILLISEDLDELLALADRIMVIAGGRIVYATAASDADRTSLGRHLGS